MKNLLIGAGLGYLAYLLVGKKSEQKPLQESLPDYELELNPNTLESRAQMMTYNESSYCRTCQRPDGTYYMNVNGSCFSGDTCVSHGK